ncbi:MAG: LysR family transcriptional regulator [Bdellovibrionales bacterium]|nr:LysR family transcriptional regulator [Bdellovibrionales bacterium]
MKTWINYHHLLYFKVIAEEGSVSRAAELLRLGQPTLSAQLKQFEENLSVQLFERRHRKLMLTEQGKIALDYAKQIFGLGNEMFEVLHDKIIPSRTHVQIAALDSIPKQVILQLTKAAYQAGQCHLSLIEGKSDEIVRELAAHRVDLMVTNFVPTMDSSKGLVHRLIVEKAVSIYGAPKFRHLRKNFPESIQGQQVVLPTYDSKLRYDLEHWSKLKGIMLDAIAETQDVGLTKLMAVEGMALIPAAGHTVNRQVLAGELIEIGKLDGIKEDLYLVMAQRKRVNSIATDIFQKFNL